MLMLRFLIICELMNTYAFHRPPLRPHSLDKSPVAGTLNDPSVLARLLLMPKEVPTFSPRRRLKNFWVAGAGPIGPVAPGERLTLMLPFTLCEILSPRPTARITLAKFGSGRTPFTGAFRFWPTSTFEDRL